MFDDMPDFLQGDMRVAALECAVDRTVYDGGHEITTDGLLGT